jgi:hypothetical protein
MKFFYPPPPSPNLPITPYYTSTSHFKSSKSFSHINKFNENDQCLPESGKNQSMEDNLSDFSSAKTLFSFLNGCRNDHLHLNFLRLRGESYILVQQHFIKVFFFLLLRKIFKYGISHLYFQILHYLKQ